MSLDSTDGTILRMPLDPSAPDTVSIVGYLNQLAVEFGRNPQVRIYTEFVLPASLANNDIPGQIRASLDFVKERVLYVADPEGTEYVKSPLVMFGDIVDRGRAIGDCDDHCLLLASMLRSLGMDARIIGVKQSSASTYFDHVIVQVQQNGQWIDLDPCAKQVGTPHYPERLIV